VKVFTTRHVGGAANDVFRRGDARRRLWQKIEFELLDQKFLVGGEFGVTAEDQGAAVGGGEAANLSSTALGERPGATSLSRARSVTCRQ